MKIYYRPNVKGKFRSTDNKNRSKKVELLPIFNWYFSTLTGIFVNHKRNIRKQRVKTVSRGNMFTVCSHIFIILLMTKTSVRVEIFPYAVLVYLCLFIRKPLNFFKSFPFLWKYIIHYKKTFTSDLAEPFQYNVHHLQHLMVPEVRVLV